MALLGRMLAVSIPDTVLEDKESPREKTAKLGLIARACATYGVDVIEVFGDRRGKGDVDAIRTVLEYLETPQYLRRRLYPIDEMLKYAGILPPLRIPSHKARVPAHTLSPGETREGVVNEDGTVDIGLDANPRLRGTAIPGKRVTVRVVSVRPLEAEPIAKENVRGYWGYSVESRSSAEVLYDKRFKVKIATSRLGSPLKEALGRLQEALSMADGVKLIFGSPSKGLFDIFGQGLSRQVDFVLNLYPEQHVETVRTEEAIFAGLNLVSILTA
ncbi:MAG: methylase [Thaumarchaeota archaeon]|nr:methylase [Nitrososphaerota archaeon]